MRRIIVLFICALLTACLFGSNTVAQYTDIPSATLAEQIDSTAMATQIDGVHQSPTPTSPGEIIKTLLPGYVQYPVRTELSEDIKWIEYVIGSTEGLPKMSVRNITSGPDGKTWIASSTGVYFYDGIVWGAYSEDDGLVDNNAIDLAVDEEGVLWVGTVRGISRFNGESWQKFTTEDGLLGNYVYSIAVDAKGEVWCAVRDEESSKPYKGINHYDGSTWASFDENNGLPSNVVREIEVDKTGGVWVATNKGLVYGADNSWTTFTSKDYWPESIYRDTSTDILSIAISPDGAIWFLTSGLGITQLHNGQWENYSHELFYYNAHSIAVTPDDKVWICSTAGTDEHERELVSFDGIVWTEYIFPSANYCFSIHGRSDNSLWVSTEISIMKYELSE